MIKSIITRLLELMFYWLLKNRSKKYQHSNCWKYTIIEAFTHGNPSPLFKRNFSYRISPVLRATLWPNQWSHRLLLGIKWKIWTLSFHWYPLIFCGLSSLVTAASQSQAFFQKVENAENWPVLPRSKTQIKFFWHFFSNGCHS